MCGFAGVLVPGGLGRDAGDGVRAMTERLAHRGPDDAGIWLDHEAGIALAHRRLAVLDLSPAGAQPMRSPSGRYVIAFNGEIYNHNELREELAERAIAWRGRSDTETLLATIERWGVRPALERCIGMFAFALWDRAERCLTLGRDRLGEKPCYYGWTRGRLAFASELKALRALPGYDAPLDRDVLALYLRYGYVPAPWSIHRGVAKLPAGCLVRWGPATVPGAMPEPEPYWSLRDVAQRGLEHPFSGDDRAAVDELERLLQRSIALQSVADVPLGAFLSGGVDSSAVVALMQAQASRPVRTFTIGFAEGAYDESAHARSVARHLGTDHTELTVTPDEALAALTRIPAVYDEPYGDASAIPTLLLAALARRHVTVSLSGDGGDELFAGYGRYHRVDAVWSRVQRAPPALRSVAATALAAVPARLLGTLLARARPNGFAHLLPQRVRSLQVALRAGSVLEPYREVMSVWSDPASLLEGDVREPPSALTDPGLRLGAGRPIDAMAYADGITYLPDDVLVKVDRAAMAVSLETRVPLLDHRLVAFAWSLPPEMKTRDGVWKWVLRRVLDRYVPAQLIERPKMGFGVPMDRWLRGPLRGWAEELLSAERLRSDGYLRPAPVRAAWEAHCAGRADWQHRLWPLLALQVWLDQERGR